MEEKVSVIVPVYNVEKYLDRCITSLLKQSYGKLEIILVNDGSTDDSGIICDSFAHNNSSIRVIHKKNGGLSSARNSGMEIMRGDFFTFVDSDDWIEPNYVKELLNNLKISNVDIVQCGFRKINEKYEITYDSCIYSEMLLSPNDILDSFFKTQNLQTMACMKLYRTDMFGDIRFEDGRNNEDTIFFADIIDRIKNIKIIDDKLYNYYINPDSIMHSHINIKKVEDAFYSAEYMLNKCIKCFPDYSIYMKRNICNLCTGLYMQDGDNKNEKLLHSMILEKFNEYYCELKINKDILSSKTRIKFLLFRTSKILYRIIWRLTK